jgi:hypothetical protein
MKFVSLSVILLSAAGMSGCMVSLQPFYTAATLLDDRSIEGRWTDGESAWEVTRTEAGHYLIASCETEGEPCKADTTGVLFRVAGVTLLDFQEKSSGLDTAIYPHGLFKIELRNGEFDVASIDDDYVKRLAESRLLDADHVQLESRVFLTAKSDLLQRFVLSHLSDPKFFGEPVRLFRPGAVRAAAPSEPNLAPTSCRRSIPVALPTL